MSGFTPEKQVQARSLGKTVAEKVSLYFRDAQHRKDFELWYENKHGKPYQWKKVTV